MVLLLSILGSGVICQVLRFRGLGSLVRGCSSCVVGECLQFRGRWSGVVGQGSQVRVHGSEFASQGQGMRVRHLGLGVEG